VKLSPVLATVVEEVVKEMGAVVDVVADFQE
jgi:hypothetical protein